MNHETLIRTNCLVVDLRAYLNQYANLTPFDIKQWHKDMADALTGLEKHLEGIK